MILRCLVLLIALASCTRAPPLAPNCAVRPKEFRTFADPGWNDFARPIEPPLIVKVRLAGARGRPHWNGVPLGGQIEDLEGWRSLRMYLDQAGQLEPMPFVTLLFDRGTSCGAVERARALIRQGLQCRESRRCFQGPSPY